MITDILIQSPPFLDKILEHGMRPDLKSTVFTYGSVLYNPGDGFIPGHLMVHENIHSEQQGEEPDKWIDRYLNEAEFRLEQEVEAYHHQYVYFCRLNKDKNTQFNFLRQLGEMLASPMYNLSIDYKQAMELIKSYKIK